MNCPKCNHGQTKVITTRDVVNKPGAKCRYRHCPRCLYRWYALVPAEIALPDNAVHWSYNLIEVYHK
jgi:transcriptional regulator NrdR family protein